jgi:Niemann-Pick C1 protein
MGIEVYYLSIYLINYNFSFIEYMHNISTSGRFANNCVISYSSERSIEDEIDRQSKSDVFTIVLSYSLMFIYISFALGRYPINNRCCQNCIDSSIFIRSKLLLGAVGVIIVALSVSSAIGICAFVGVSATMIVVEVLPFLVLAVGVDNIFIIVQSYQVGEMACLNS